MPLNAVKQEPNSQSATQHQFLFDELSIEDQQTVLGVERQIQSLIWSKSCFQVQVSGLTNAQIQIISDGLLAAGFRAERTQTEDSTTLTVFRSRNALQE